MDTRRVSALGLLSVVVMAGCGSGGGHLGGSQGLRRGPSDQAFIIDYPQGPDSVLTIVWESLRRDDIMARSFQRAVSDSANTAAMESDWIYIPNVIPTAPVTSLRETELWVKLLFWGVPERGGTRLFMDMMYDPVGPPAEPTQWGRMQSVPRNSPAWGMAEFVSAEINRRLDAER